MSNETKNEVISKDLMTIPNAISFVRILLITPFVAFFIAAKYITGNYIPAIIIIALIWRWTGYNMVFYLAGLQNIDYQVYEAAKIDGASPWSTFWR